MATVSLLATGSTTGATSFQMTGLNYQVSDYIVAVTASFSSPASEIFFSNGERAYLISGTTVTAANPDLSAFFYVNSGTQGVLSSGTATFYQSASQEAAVVMYRITPDPGKEIVLRSVNYAGVNATSGSVSTAASGSGDEVIEGSIIIGMGAVGDDTYLTDSDTFNGTWSASTIKTVNAGDDLGAFAQYKITTGGTGAQSFGGSWASLAVEAGLLFIAHLYETDRPYWGMVEVS